MFTEIQKCGYVFLVDRDKTSEYYAAHSICDCDGCQNFYRQIKGQFSELERFLTELGVDISRPDNIMWYDADNCIGYNPCYTVTGNIKAFGEYEIDFGYLNAVFYQGDDPTHDIPNEQTEPYFVIEIFNITLPWVIDAPFPSTSIKKNFIVRLIDKIKNK